MAESFYSWSGYHYAYNNPIIVVDPDGNFNEYVIDQSGQAHQVSDLGGDDFDVIHTGTVNEDGSITVEPESTTVVDVETVVQEHSEMSFRWPGIKKVSGGSGIATLDGTDDPIFTLLTVGLSGTIGKADDGLQVLGFAQKKVRRPKFRKGIVEKVWEMAKRKNGKVFDPDTGREIIWDKTKLRRGQWDMGHKEGKEWWRQVVDFLRGKKTRKQLRDEYNDPTNYKPELPSSNRRKNKKK